MTHPTELDANAEIPTDFASHLAERLQLAPDAVLAHLEFWLAHYPRSQRVVRDLVKTHGSPNDLGLLVTVG